MHIVAELGAQLRDDAGEEGGHLVEIGVVRGVAVHAAEADALEEFVDPGPDRVVIDEADIGQHMREALLARIPVRQQGAGIVGLIQGFAMAHSCRPRGRTGSASAASPAAPSSSRR